MQGFECLGVATMLTLGWTMDKVPNSGPKSAFRELPINAWRKNVVLRHVDDGRHYYERRTLTRRASVRGGAVAASMPTFNFDQNSELEAPCRVMQLGLRVLVVSAHVIDDTTLQMDLREGEFHHHPLVINLRRYCAHGLAKLPLPEIANKRKRAELKIKYQKNHKLVCDLLDSVEVYQSGEPANSGFQFNSTKISGLLQLKAPNPDEFWGMVGQRSTEMQNDSKGQKGDEGAASSGEDDASWLNRSQAEFEVRTISFLRQTLAEVTGKNSYVSKWQTLLSDSDSDGGVCGCNLDRDRLHLRMRMRKAFRRFITIMRRIKACIWNQKFRLSRLIILKVCNTQEQCSAGKKLKVDSRVALKAQGNSQGALTAIVENSCSRRTRSHCVESSNNDVESHMQVTAQSAIAAESTMTAAFTEERRTLFWRRVSAILNLPIGHRRKRGDLDILEQAVFESNQSCTLHEIFENLSRPVRDQLLSMAKQIQVPPNTIVVRKGEPINHAYVVLAGSLEYSLYPARHVVARPNQTNSDQTYGAWTDVNGSFGEETLRLLNDSSHPNDERRTLVSRFCAQPNKCANENAPRLWEYSVRTKAHTWLMKLPRSVTMDIIEQQMYKEKSTIKSALSKIGLIETANEATVTETAGLLRYNHTTRFSPSYAVNSLHSLAHRRIYKANEIITRQGTPACVNHIPPVMIRSHARIQNCFDGNIRQARTLLCCIR